MSFTAINAILAAVPLKAEEIFGSDTPLGPYVTNSTVIAVLVMVFLIWFVRSALKKRQLIPGTRQNIAEFVFEKVYGLVEGMLGQRLAKKTFPLLGTLFIFILFANWFGLFPGVGTIGFAPSEDVIGISARDSAHLTPLLRPANADINMTLGMALCAMVLWVVMTIKELGVKGFIEHTFGAKGGLTGFIGKFVAVVFFVVGLIEVVSILARPLTLSLRLFGNLFAGENLLHTMGDLMKSMGAGTWIQFLGRVFLPLPFYFLEILVGLIQAFVFMLLCTVYILLSSHGDDHAHEEHAHGAH